jgi:hypothetical protein
MLSQLSLKVWSIAPTLLGATLLAASPSLASELVVESESVQSAPTLTADEMADEAIAETPLSTVPTVSSLEQIEEYSNTPTSDANQMGQVTSISQLSDVQPTDWAFQALQSLVERYGVIAGYPDGTYRGNRAMTRYEFAAGLNAALDRVNELIAAGLADAVTREDLATLQRLQEEFAAELATLRGRVDALEARTAELEANQFSTTTTLEGRTQFVVAAPIEEDEQFDDQVTFGYRARLNFDTSFTGEDELRVRLQAREFQAFEGDPLGFQADGDTEGDFEIDDLYYTFPFGDRTSFTIAANGVDIDDLVPDVTYPLGASSDNGALSEFADPRQYEQGFAGSGAGAGVEFQLIDNENFGLNLAGGYISSEASSPDAGSGLFNGDYSAIGQLTFTSNFVDLSLTYVNSYSDSAFDGEVYDVDGAAVANTYGGQINFKLFNEAVQLGGGVAYTDVSGIGAADDYDLWSYQGTLAFPDLGGEGNLLGILAGVPSYTRDLPGQSRDVSFLAEIFYRYALTDNITLTPSLIYIADPFNNNENDETFIGALRTTFSF